MRITEAKTSHSEAIAGTILALLAARAKLQNMLNVSDVLNLDTCKPEDLGTATHSIQDKWAHSVVNGPAGPLPLAHYLTSTSVDILAAQNPVIVDNAMQETVSMLRVFKAHSHRKARMGSTLVARRAGM